MQQSTFHLDTLDGLPTTACGEQPRQRFENFGVEALSDTELIALLLHAGVSGHGVLGVASLLIAQAGSLAGLSTWTPEDFQRVKGIGRAKARQLAALVEVSRRMMKSSTAAAPVLSRPEEIAAHMLPFARGLMIEKFWVLCLNRKNRLIKLEEITSGLASATLAHPREVFRVAIRHGASAVVCAHNHPSGDPAPSAADLQMTRQLGDAARTIDIPLLDHVIVGELSADPVAKGFYSFRSAGLL